MQYIFLGGVSWQYSVCVCAFTAIIFDTWIKVSWYLHNNSFPQTPLVYSYIYWFYSPADWQVGWKGIRYKAQSPPHLPFTLIHCGLAVATCGHVIGRSTRGLFSYSFIPCCKPSVCPLYYTTYQTRWVPLFRCWRRRRRDGSSNWLGWVVLLW